MKDFEILQKADVAVGGMVMSASFYRIVDVARLHSSVLGCMIPAPKSTTYLGATWLPFSYLVHFNIRHFKEINLNGLQRWGASFIGLDHFADLYYCSCGFTLQF